MFTNGCAVGTTTYGMPMVDPLYRPEPKSGCSFALPPMKLMIAFELGSSGALAMFVFHRLLGRKGRNPFKLPSAPRLSLMQEGPCAYPRLETVTVTAASKQLRKA